MITERTITIAAVAALALALVAGALGLAAERSSVGGVAPWAKPKLGNNKRAKAVVRFFGMAPGDTRKRRVRISNRKGRARLTLKAVAIEETAGPNGGLLGSALRVNVRRIRGAHTKRKGKLGRKIFHGPLREMTSFKLGHFRRHSARNYRFKVILPDNGAPPSANGGDNAYQGSRARVNFRWVARSGR